MNRVTNVLDFIPKRYCHLSHIAFYLNRWLFHARTFFDSDTEYNIGHQQCARSQRRRPPYEWILEEISIIFWRVLLQGDVSNVFVLLGGGWRIYRYQLPGCFPQWRNEIKNLILVHSRLLIAMIIWSISFFLGSSQWLIIETSQKIYLSLNLKEIIIKF